MDLKKSRYKNLDELYLYCYYVAGTVRLMSVPITGIAPISKTTLESIYNVALSLEIANQLTNILLEMLENNKYKDTFTHIKRFTIHVYSMFIT